MDVKAFGLMIFIAAISMVSFCSGQEDGVVEVISIDGPGGYLPDTGNDITADNTDEGLSLAQPPSIDEGSPILDAGYSMEGYSMDQLTIQKDWLDIINYLEAIYGMPGVETAFILIKHF